VRDALSRVVPVDRITVIPCAVDVPLNESAANLGAGGPVIVTVAALTLEKGVDRAIRLAASARALGARWLIVGDGAERGALEQLARELNAPVTFLGWRDDVGSILRAADLMVHLPREEGLGLAVLEALARGVPVVAANVGGLPESVTTDVGTLIDPADLAVALDAVRRWLGDGARAEVARLAPAFAARFSADRLAAATIAVYADALGAAPIRAIRPIRAIA
jgi:glycosyltransferase involved in cell wall biosynthesis